MNDQINRYKMLAEQKLSVKSISDNKEELEKLLGISDEDIQRVTMAEPLPFEEAKLGSLCRYPKVLLTSEMRERHLQWYGEDWPEKRRAEARRMGLMPAPVVLSIVAGQGGNIGWLDVKVAQYFTAKFYHPFFVGDTIETICEITEIVPHKNRAKEYGYVTVQQDMFNQSGELAYERSIGYAVFRI